MSIQMLKKRFAGKLGKGILLGLIAVFIVTLPAMFSSGGGFFGGGKEKEQAAQQGDSGDTVARLNGQPLLRGAYDAAFKSVLGQMQMLAAQYAQFGQSIGIDRLMSMRMDALKLAESNALMASDAKERGITVSDRELNEKIDQLVENDLKGMQQQVKGQQSVSVEQLYAQVAARSGGPQEQTMSERAFRQWYRDQLWNTYRSQLETQLLSDKLKAAVAPVRPVTDAELLASYDRITPREILVSLKPVGKPARTEAEAKQRAAELLARVRGGADFAAVAKAESDMPEAKTNGGLRDSMSVSGMDPQWVKLVAPLQAGQLASEPVKQSYGYSIIKVEKRERQLPPDFEKNKQQERNTLATQRQDQAWNAYMQELSSKAKIEVTDPELKGYEALMQGKSGEGLKQLQKAAEAPDKLGQSGAASVFYQLAVFSSAKNDWAAAAEYYSRADDYVSDREFALPEAHVQTLMGMGHAHENLYREYTQKGKAKEAASELDEALTWYQAASDAAMSPSYHQQLQRSFVGLNRKDLADKEQQWLTDYQKQEAEKAKALEAQQRAMEQQGKQQRPTGPSPVTPKPAGSAAPPAKPAASAPKPAAPQPAPVKPAAPK